MKDILINDFHIGDIILIHYYTTSESYEALKSKIIILKTDLLLDLIVMDIGTNEIFSIKLDNIIKYSRLSNLAELTDNINNLSKEKVWLGIEYQLEHGCIRLLVNLKEKFVEIYDIEKDEWNEISDYTFNKKDLLIDLVDYGIKFKYVFSNNKLYLKKKNGLNFRIYRNFLLGGEEDYVFNYNNELELISN